MAGDGVDDAADALALGAQLADGLPGLGRGFADGGHGLGGARDRLGADAGGRARLVGGARGLLASWAEAVVAPATCSVVRARGHGAHLALGAGGDVAQRAGDLLDRAAGVGRRRGDELRGAGHAGGRARHLAHRGAQLGDEAGEGGAETVAAERGETSTLRSPARRDRRRRQRAEMARPSRRSAAAVRTDLVAAFDGELVVDVALGEGLGGAREARPGGASGGGRARAPGRARPGARARR
jgi:hypothetical protein